MADEKPPAPADSAPAIDGAIEAKVTKEIDGFFDELDDLLKNADVQQVLASRRVNASIAMLVVDGLRAYLQGEKAEAIEDLGAAAEEIAQRYAQNAKGDA